MQFIKIIIIIFGLVNFLTLISFAQGDSGNNLSIEDFDQSMASSSNPQLIDVRTPEEYKNGHLKEALNVDWNSNEFDYMINALDKNQPVYVYCLSGARSASAAEKMRNSGFKEVFEMNGGILAWNKSGKPTVSPKISADPNMTMEDLQKNLSKDKLILVDFNAIWCAPCKKMAPMLEELSNNQKEMMHLLKINVDDHKKLVASMEVYILPTLILYKNDKIVWRNEGFIESKKLLEVIQSFN
jgi:thioredoxin